MMKTAKLRTDPHCPRCNELLSGFTNPHGDWSPKPGDISVCINCHEILEFTNSMGLKTASADSIVACDFTQLQCVNKMVRALADLRSKEEESTNGQK